MRQFWQKIVKYRWFISGGLIVIAMVFSILSSANRQLKNSTPSPSPKATSYTSPQVSDGASLAVPTPRVSLAPGQLSLTESAILYPSLDSQTKILYFQDFNTVTIRQFHLDTNQATDLSLLTAYILDIAWSPNHTQILLKLENDQGSAILNPFYQSDVPYGDTVNGLYDLKGNKFTRLNSSIQTFAWLNNDQIIYQYADKLFNNLSVSKPDGSDWKNIDSLTGTIQISNAGQTALIQKDGSDKVVRYGKDGKILETYAVPSELRLNQSAWLESGRSAVYWFSASGGLTISRLKTTGVESVANLNQNPDNPAILWDNKSGEIYLASLSGLIKLGTSQP